jgi:hypothetical protein
VFDRYISNNDIATDYYKTRWSVSKTGIVYADNTSVNSLRKNWTFDSNDPRIKPLRDPLAPGKNILP